MYTLVCPCIFGLEKIVSFELRRVGATDIVADNGKVTARGDALTVAKANLGLRCAERVLIQLAQFPATSIHARIIRNAHAPDRPRSCRRFTTTAAVGQSRQTSAKAAVCVLSHAL